MVGVDSISSSAVMSQFEHMSARMNAMAQRGQALSEHVQAPNNLVDNANHPVALSGQSEFFSGMTAAAALRDQPIAPSDAAAAGTASGYGPAGSAGETVGEFKQLLTDAIENVNRLQHTSSSMQARFDVGDRSISLADVMIASNKSSLAFEATLQIRNKLVDAYQSIMQMQI